MRYCASCGRRVPALYVECDCIFERDVLPESWVDAALSLVGLVLTVATAAYFLARFVL